MEYKADVNRYSKMKYRRSGNSGLLLPAISLGLWHNFGEVDTLENAKKMIFRAFDLGITHFDLANNYGPPPGTAETNFGRILNQHLRSYRDEMIISSKAGYYMWPGPYGEWGSRKNMISSIDQSLQRLGIDYLDIFYSHRFDPNTPLEETMGALDYIVRSGRALYVGISSYDVEQTRQAVKILNDLGTPCLIHQPPYSLFNRKIEEGLTEVLDELELGCIVFTPLAQGMLTDKYLDGIPTDSRAAKAHGFLKAEQITKERLEKIDQLNNLAKSRSQSLAQMAIAWVLNNPTVTSAVCGASKVKHIEDNVAALDNLEFSTEELDKIDRILAT